MDDALLQPQTLAVSVHPSHHHGDRVSVQFHDGPTGYPYRVLLTPEAAEYLATLLQTAVESPRIGAAADQIRTAQRERA